MSHCLKLPVSHVECLAPIWLSCASIRRRRGSILVVSPARVLVFERSHQQYFTTKVCRQPTRETRAGSDRVRPHVMRFEIETRGARESGESETTDTAFDSFKGGLVGWGRLPWHGYRVTHSNTSSTDTTRFQPTPSRPRSSAQPAEQRPKGYTADAARRRGCPERLVATRLPHMMSSPDRQIPDRSLG